jgi:murein DD-endopeptidase MepM/ murein hydrolase activator NlpD
MRDKHFTGFHGITSLRGAIAVAFCVAVSLMLATPVGFATEPTTSELQDTLKDVKSNLEQAHDDYDTAVARLKELDAKISELNGQISEQTSQIALQQEKIDAQQAEIDDYDAQIEKKKKQIKKMEDDITDQNNSLNQRLRVMYETGDESMLVVLLGSENIVDFLANIDMIQAIHKSDQELLEEMERKLDDLEEKKKELEIIEALLVAEKAEMETQKKALEDVKASLEGKKAEVAAAESEVKAIRDAALEDIEALEAESKRITDELAKRTSTWEYGGGAMSWPVQGRITSEYGMRTNPVTGIYVLHAGIDIGVAYGTPVHAAADGIVISAAWAGGYGNLVMIDNGSNITTCYAHNSSFAVSAGQEVKRGDIIAYAGSTGNSTGPHVHFEVRVKGVPQNPRGWL